MRDYQFLHTLLYRDHATVLDILLQTAQPGISQEAHKLLDEFPTRREELYDYDCIVAFDPDWKALRPGADRLAGRLGRRPRGRADRRGRAGLHRRQRGRLGAGPGDGQDPHPLSGRVLSPAGGRRPERATPAASPGRWSSPAKGRRPSSCGWATRRARRSRPGPAFPACTASVRCAGRSRGPRVLAEFSDPRAADRRPAAAVLRRAVLRLRPRVLHGQRRDVAAPPGRSRCTSTSSTPSSSATSPRDGCSAARPAACSWSARTITCWATRSTVRAQLTNSPGSSRWRSPP